MLNEIDAALRGLLVAGLPAGSAVSFAAPEGAWTSGGEPTLNVFLYQLYEDLQARIAHWTDLRDEDNRVVGRRPPPRRYRACYLLTAWTPDVDGEHELLGVALRVLAEHDCIPTQYLSGSLATADQPVQLQVAPPDLPAPPMELWPALGIRPRTHVGIVVSAPLVPAVRTDLPAAPTTVDLGVGSESTDRASRPLPTGRPARRIRENP